MGVANVMVRVVVVVCVLKEGSVCVWGGGGH